MKKWVIYFVILFFSFFVQSSCAKDSGKDQQTSELLSLPPVSKNSIRVASYNLLFEKSVPAEENRRWSNRIEQVKHIFTDCNLDIIGSQEALTFQVNQLLSSLNDFGRIGGDLGTGGLDNPKAENEAVFYRRSRFDVLESGNFWYSLTPNTPGTYGWDATYPRMCTWGKFKEKTTGKIFYVFNSQFHYDAYQSRIESAKILMKKVHEVSAEFPVLVTGDLNDTPGSEAISSLLDDGTLSDSREIAKLKSGPVGTYHGFNTLQIPTSRIDYILVTNNTIHVDYYRVADEELANQRFGSDHLPVIVDVTFLQNQ